MDWNKLLENPQMWAVFLLALILYGAYQIIVVHYPKWREASDTAKKERAQMYISSNEKLFEMLGGKIDDIKDKVIEIDSRCQARTNGKALKVEV